MSVLVSKESYNGKACVCVYVGAAKVDGQKRRANGWGGIDSITLLGLGQGGVE